MTNQKNTTAEEAIRKIVDDYAATWNGHDMDAWGKLFADNVDYVNRAGGWWQSNDENIKGHRRIHEMLIEQGQPATFHLEVRKITFLKPDVALVHVESNWPGFNPLNGTQTTSGISGIITMVLEKKEEKWLIRALQNTLKQTPEINKNYSMNTAIATKIKNALINADVNEDWSQFLELMDEKISFSATIPDGTPISGVFEGKDQVVNYFTNILPSVASFHQNKPMEYIIQKDKVIVLGDDTYTVLKNQKSQRSAFTMIIDFVEEKITKILIIQDLSGIYMAYID